MKTRDIKELHTKTENELAKMLKDLRENLAALRFEKTQNKVKNTSELSNLRNKIAIIQTIIREKELIKNV